MNTALKLAGVAVAACTGCYAGTVVPLMLASASAVLVGGATIKWCSVAVLLVVPVAGLLVRSRRKSSPEATVDKRPTEKNCGSGSSSTDIRHKAPIALDANEFNARTKLTRTLTSRHLRHATRTALRLNLTNGPEPFSEVRELVQKEQACRAFLTFDFRHDVSGAFLTITAPEAAAEAADDLFAHFAPSSFAMEISG